MTNMVHDAKNQIIGKVIKLIQKNFSKKKAELLTEFARQYYGTVSVEDLQLSDINHLYGNLISQWNFIYVREDNETKIRIFNPVEKHDGWKSTHTIVEISVNDMPFLVDSCTMELDRNGFNIHFIIHMGSMQFKRNSQHQIIKLFPHQAHAPDRIPEAILHLEIDRQTDPEVIKNLEENLSRVLEDVRAAVQDWTKMKESMLECLSELTNEHAVLDDDELKEAKDFLYWLVEGNFTFLGSRDYKMGGDGNKKALKLVRGSGLGVLRDESESKASRTIADMPVAARRQFLSKQILIIAKSNTVATVHRSIYTDYIGVKRFNAKGEMIGERRFVGLYTSSAYNTSPRFIPFLRRKIEQVMALSGLYPLSHAGKALLNIIETLPRDDLFQTSAQELYELGMGIYHLQERLRIRLFIRKDIYDRFFSCYIYLPRERVDTELCFKLENILLQAFSGTEASHTTYFGESRLARIHIIIRLNRDLALPVFSLKDLETNLFEASRTWEDNLKNNLITFYVEEHGNCLFKKYKGVFPLGYQEEYSPHEAVIDTTYIEKLSNDNSIEMNLFQIKNDSPGLLHFKLFQIHEMFTLSDVLPLFENMGLKVIEEYSHELKFKNNLLVWVNDFVLINQKTNTLELSLIRDLVLDTFGGILSNKIENDGFNRLVISACLNYRDVSVLRAYAKYLRQTGFTLSQTYIEAALSNHPEIANQLVSLFYLRFNPQKIQNRENKCSDTEQKIKDALEEVSNIDEDRIIRRYLELIMATIRTNFFQKDVNGTSKSYISFKFDPQLISNLPQPKPKFEIFVYSPSFEAVHLRAAKVARGGIRWSDRREDFRTEILGLMKAQQVKNSVIVPQGAKGGFFPKQLPSSANREAILEEAISCYKNFMRGLLDITDNIVNGKIVPPLQVVRYDQDDPYLVVAADKGTASFSDIANSISNEYNFWLGDAFASGGSVGYDHKKMGITARGAWESVKRHFQELTIDIDKTDFTVVGIGDMSGDVFGNGMLLSKHIKLVGAFNHKHIFLDPNPDVKISFMERQRLFNLPRSSWDDYNPKLISNGGGVYDRSLKSIKLSPQIKALLNLEVDVITPSDLIRALLLAQVDLLWNGGIGTYVKASYEIDFNVGDHANDSLRVSGNELRCRVVGEGGNLGFTQLARVEYSLNGGMIFTDFIDNSAGVDCSDHEVNIKILLNHIVASGEMSEKQRNRLLADMTDEVAHLVLQDNFRQTQVLSRANYCSYSHLELHANVIQELEHFGHLNRTLEFLPSVKGFIERRNMGKGLTRPELAVLLSYSKNTLKQQILESDVPEDPFLLDLMQYAFPAVLYKRYKKIMHRHGLRREIIATQLSNMIINDLGLTFIMRLRDETGASIEAIIRACLIPYRIFNVQELLAEINKFDQTLSLTAQVNVVSSIGMLVRRAARWLLYNYRDNLNIPKLIDRYVGPINELRKWLPDLLSEKSRKTLDDYTSGIGDLVKEESLNRLVQNTISLFPAFDIVEHALVNKINLREFSAVYYDLSDFLELNWLREQIAKLTVENRWQALARVKFRDDIDVLQARIVLKVISNTPKKMTNEKRFEFWQNKYPLAVERWFNLVANLRASSIDYTKFFIALRDLYDLMVATRK